MSILCFKQQFFVARLHETELAGSGRLTECNRPVSLN